METLTKTDKLKIGFLGVGWIGKNRMEALSKVDNVLIAAIADTNPQLVAEASHIAPKASVGQNLEDLLQQELDAVVIATPSALHAEQSIAALEKGLAVFCQKPLGRDYAETKAVVDTAQHHNKLLGVDFSYRHTCFRKIYDLIHSGELGEIYAVDLVFHNAYGPDKSWFYNPKLSGGGCVVDLGVHLVDLALWSLNFPEVSSVNSRLYAQGNLIHHLQDQVEDYASVDMLTAHGTTIQMSCSWNLPAGCDAVIHATFYGTKGGASFQNINGSFYDFKAERYNGTTTTLLAGPPDQWGGKAIADWAQQLYVSDHFRNESQELVAVAALLDRIYKRI
ncbi:MAG TPA: Gfo/Idh/MocA family oxidoreductase [Cytophagales bacterium]|nr:Gfo/Idh/MocA family oxidoreductase [Cytophagales bacterium]